MLTRIVLQRQGTGGSVADPLVTVTIPPSDRRYSVGDVVPPSALVVIDTVPFLSGTVGDTTVVVVIDAWKEVEEKPLPPPPVIPSPSTTSLCLVSSLARPLGLLLHPPPPPLLTLLPTQAYAGRDSTLGVSRATLRGLCLMSGQGVRIITEEAHRYATVILDPDTPDNNTARVSHVFLYNSRCPSGGQRVAVAAAAVPTITSCTLRPISLSDIHSSSTSYAATLSIEEYVRADSAACCMMDRDVVVAPVRAPNMAAALEVSASSVRDLVDHTRARFLYFAVEDVVPRGGGRFDPAASVLVVQAPVVSPRASLPVIAPDVWLSSLPPYDALSASVNTLCTPLLVVGSENNYTSEMTLAALRASGRNAISIHMSTLGASPTARESTLVSMRKLAEQDPTAWYVFHHYIAVDNLPLSSFPAWCVVIVETGTDDVPLSFTNSFAVVIKVDNPNESQRGAWVQSLLSKCVVSATFQIDAAAAATTAMSYRDIATCVELATHRGDEEVMSQEAFLASARAHAEAIGVRLTSTRIDPVLWKDIGGLATAKSHILEMVQLPLLYPHMYKNIKKRTGVLLYGPPGCGKTLLAKAVATECKLNFMSVKGPELLNMYVGESEKNVRDTFRMAREASPCVLFFDELDALAPNRGAKGDSGGVMDRIVSQLLTELDGASSANSHEFVFVIGATNRPDLLDQSLLRTGRFDASCYLGLPSTREDQLATVLALLRKFQFSHDVDVKQCVEQMPLGVFTGADYYGMATDAIMRAVEDTGGVVVHQRHLEAARDALTPSLSADEIRKYARMNV